MSDRTAAVDMGEVLAFYIRLQRHRGSSDAGRLSPVERRQLTRDHVDLFLRLLAINRIDFACEVGAHEASFAKRAKKSFPAARVIAFEANPTIFDLHQEAVAAGGVEFYPLCVADRAGTTKIKVPMGQDGLRDTMGSTLDFAGADEYRHFDCETVSLNEFLADFAFERAALWVDVEGAASLVFQGADRILENCVAIYVEVEDRALWSGQKIDSDVFRFLLDFGFVPVATDLQKSWQYNVILIKHDQLTSRPISRAISNFHSQVQARPDSGEAVSAVKPAPVR